MEQRRENLNVYLEPTKFIDSDSPEIINFVSDHVYGISDVTEKLIHLYYLVRDNIKYDFYTIDISKESLVASEILKKQRGYCIPKAILLTALARAIGVPCRLGFADVRNHLATEKVLTMLRTDLFVFHGYVEVFLQDKWIKATPAFDRTLCEKFGVKALDFDGEHDSIFQAFDKEGGKYMEYINDYGCFADLPHGLMTSVFCEAYPHIFNKNNSGTKNMTLLWN